MTVLAGSRNERRLNAEEFHCQTELLAFEIFDGVKIENLGLFDGNQAKLTTKILKFCDVILFQMSPTRFWDQTSFLSFHFFFSFLFFFFRWVVSAVDIYECLFVNT